MIESGNLVWKEIQWVHGKSGWHAKCPAGCILAVWTASRREGVLESSEDQVSAEEAQQQARKGETQKGFALVTTFCLGNHLGNQC